MLRVVALRSRRLEALFGASLDLLTADHVRGLVASGAQEAFDLDFKAALYGRGDSDRRALAGDVAALANTAGGVIVVGVREDEQARATAAPGVEVTDAEVTRIRQVVASLVAPLPVFDVVTVADSPGDADSAAEPVDAAEPADPQMRRGYLLIAVPRRPTAPHAVLINAGLLYPRRNGATTRYLSEPEVAAAYGERVAGAAQQAQRVVDVEREALARLDRADEPWLLVTLVPDLPGDFVITTAAYQEFQRTMVGQAVTIIRGGGTSWRRFSVGRRRLLADGSMDQTPLARWASLELHVDGSGAYAFQLYDMASDGRRMRPTDLDEPGQQIVDDESVVAATLTGLLWLAEHARDRAAAGGNAVVRAGLVPSTSAKSVEIGHARRHGIAESRSRLAIDDVVIAEAAAPLDGLASPGPTLVATAALLVDEIGQAFGVPELGQVTRDGRIRRRYWQHALAQRLVPWAEQHAIDVTDDVLQ
jgi:hypothetical protein